jgi:hypothetical protein
VASISTEGRVFSAQLTREIAARERKGAVMLHPSATTWWNAFRGFVDEAYKVRSPTKVGRMFKAATNRLVAAHNQNLCTINCFAGRSRSAYLEVFACEASKHPITQTGNDGIVVHRYRASMSLRGRCLAVTGGDALAFVSWHTLGRMRERCGIDILSAGGVVAICGVVGMIMRDSDKHLNTEINVAFKDLVCTGVMRHAESERQPGHWHGFYDVLTAIEPDILNAKRAIQMRQGNLLTNAALDYMKAEYADEEGLVAKIPVLPFHETDYVSRELITKKSVAPPPSSG